MSDDFLIGGLGYLEVHGYLLRGLRGLISRVVLGVIRSTMYRQVLGLPEVCKAPQCLTDRRCLSMLCMYPKDPMYRCCLT